MSISISISISILVLWPAMGYASVIIEYDSRTSGIPNATLDMEYVDNRTTEQQNDRRTTEQQTKLT